MQHSNYAKAYANFFDSLSDKVEIQSYQRFFDQESVFEDPFQRVIGVEKIYKVFEHMYKNLKNPRFEVAETIINGNIAYIAWVFHYETTTADSFKGVSRVEFKDDGKVVSHVDYWDAASNIYEKVPLLGAVLRFIKRKIRA